MRTAPRQESAPQALDAIGQFYRDQGRFLEAEEMLQRLVTLLEERNPDHPDLPAAYNNLATVYRYREKYSEAEKLYRRAMATLERTRGPDSPEVARAMSNVAEASLEMGRYGAAEDLIERAAGILEKAGPQYASDLAVTLDQLAKVYFSQKKTEKTREALNRSMEATRATLGAQHPNYARTLSYLATLETSEGDYKNAEKHYRQALEILEGALGRPPADGAGAGGLRSVVADEKKGRGGELAGRARSADTGALGLHERVPYWPGDAAGHRRATVPDPHHLGALPLRVVADGGLASARLHGGCRHSGAHLGGDVFPRQA
ncbi:MAG: tetratricopeptide repeat protein [Bryobacterales bacterium]